MGYFDDVKLMFGKGAAAADRKAQELRLQADLSRINSSLESAYAALGKVVYAHPTLAPQVEWECPGEFNGVTSLLKEEQDVRERIEALQREAAAAAAPKARQPQYYCTKCGGAVTLDLSYCPLCGDNLAEIKSQYRMCPNCHTYYASNASFCIECGSRIVDIPIARPLQIDTPEEKVDTADVEVTDGIDQVDEQLPVGFDSEPQNVDAEVVVADTPVAQEAFCPYCGAKVEADDVYCGDCGSRLIG